MQATTQSEQCYCRGSPKGRNSSNMLVVYSLQLNRTTRQQREREALAIVWSISKFRGYIEETYVVIITDYQAFKWLMTLKSPSGRLARWALLLRIEYAPGKANIVADMLSRPFCIPESTTQCGVCSFQVELPVLSPKITTENQLGDPEIRKILKAFLHPNDEEAISRWTNMLSQGVLYRYDLDNEKNEAQLVISYNERMKILQEYHNPPTAGHYGSDKMVKRIRSRYFWPGMRKDVDMYTKNCLPCQRYKVSNLDLLDCYKLPR